MGLLDAFNTGNPEQDQAARHGLLQMGLALLQGRGNLGSILGQAGMHGLSGMQQFQGNQFLQKQRASQLEDIKRKRVLEGRQDTLDNLPGQFIKPEQVGVDATGGMETAAENNYVPPQMDLAGLAQKYMSTPGGLQSGLALNQAIQKQTPQPIKLGKDDRLLAPGTYKEIVGSIPDPAKENKGTSDMQEFAFAQSRGEVGPGVTFTEWLRGNKKAGATNQNISLNADKGFAGDFGKNIAADFQKSQEIANSAQFSNATIGDVRKALSKGGVILGPGSELRQTGLRVGQIISAGGKGAESLANTKNVEQGLALIELEAAALIKGQGQVTEAERKIVRKAAAGQINELSPAELDVALTAIERNNKRKIEVHGSRVKKLQANPAIGSLGSMMDSTPVEKSSDEVLDWNALPKGRK